MNHDQHFSPALLAWAEQVFQERIAPGIRLERRSARELALRLPGGLSIVFDQPDARFFGKQSLPMLWWDPRSAGLRAPVAQLLPAPGYDGRTLIDRHGHGATVHYDIPGLLAWMLCRHEELGSEELDLHERFPASASHAAKHGYLSRPIVDEWIGILRQLVRQLQPQLTLSAAHFRVQPSHDVDHPSRYGFSRLPRLARTIAKDVLQRRNLADPIRGCAARLSRRATLAASDPYNTFDWLMDQSERYQLSSEFYFICGRTDPAYDGEYEIEHPAMRQLIGRMLARGHQVGLHPSYGAGRSPELLTHEAGRLGAVLNALGTTRRLGARTHYLRFTMPDTLNAMAAAGIVYDTSVGYADHIGFRSGTCFDYPAFDPVAGRAIPLRIRPLIVMDGTLSGYMGLGYGASAHAALAEVKRACRAVGGTFTLLWHNSELMQPVQREFYLAALAA